MVAAAFATMGLDVGWQDQREWMNTHGKNAMGWAPWQDPWASGAQGMRGTNALFRAPWQDPWTSGAQ
eukprot:10167331-Lingulodinium_polyedra.AAC.1